MGKKINEKKDMLEKFGTVNVAKHHVKIHTKNKTAYVSGKQISLQDYKEEYGPNAKHFSEEEIKRRHLGKVCCQVAYKTDEELLDVLDKYFSEKE